MHEEEGVGMGYEKSKILVLGGTGYLGKYMVKTSVSMDHPTYAYVRPVKPNTDNSKLDLHHLNPWEHLLSDHIKFEFVKESSKREQTMLFYAARLNFEEDVAAYTLKAAVDARTSNKVIINRPPRKYRTCLATVC
ncbi:hypothetical protein AAG906_010667 [Vitis piasezkii]